MLTLPPRVIPSIYLMCELSNLTTRYTGTSPRRPVRMRPRQPKSAEIRPTKPGIKSNSQPLREGKSFAEGHQCRAGPSISPPFVYQNQENVYVWNSACVGPLVHPYISQLVRRSATLCDRHEARATKNDAWTTIAPPSPIVPFVISGHFL